MKFKPGDLVMIVAEDIPEDFGKAGTIRKACLCKHSFACAVRLGMPYYDLTGFPNHCFREDALKKIDGERPKIETKTDEPVEA